MHGKIEIAVDEETVQQIGRWTAHRVEPLRDPDKEYTYECLVRFNDEQHNTTFSVKHVYAEGAGALVAKIFARYTEIKVKAARRTQEVMAPKSRVQPLPLPKAKSDHLDQMELEKDLREIRHRGE